LKGGIRAGWQTCEMSRGSERIFVTTKIRLVTNSL